MTAAACLASAMQRWAQAGPGPLVVGLCGSQGCGKSTVAAEAAERMQARGLRTVVLSLDDFYLRPDERRRLARGLHPLFATRGPPGTHEVGLALQVLHDLRAGEAVRVPRFDKLCDDREPTCEWVRIDGGPDLILFEGWCVGARPQPLGLLAEPVNRLEREEDPDGVWRSAVNDALAGPYAPLFTTALDRLVLLKAPAFEVAPRWRLQQERNNAANADPARRAGAMDETQVARFIQHYERLTRWMLAEVPQRADLVIALDEERRVTGVTGPG